MTRARVPLVREGGCSARPRPGSGAGPRGDQPDRARGPRWRGPGGPSSWRRRRCRGGCEGRGGALRRRSGEPEHQLHPAHAPRPGQPRGHGSAPLRPLPGRRQARRRGSRRRWPVEVPPPPRHLEQHGKEQRRPHPGGRQEPPGEGPGQHLEPHGKRPRPGGQQGRPGEVPPRHLEPHGKGERHPRPSRRQEPPGEIPLRLEPDG
jgi:hypothetical protein